MPPRDNPECPVCGSRCERPPVRHFSVEQSAAHFCPPSRSRDRYERFVKCIRRLWGGETCDVFQCNDCGHGFGWPFVGGDGEFYGLMHEMAAYPAWRWEYRLTIESVLAKRSPGRILDIGAGDGRFLSRVPSAWERWAVEASDTVRGMLTAKGLNVAMIMDDLVQRFAGTFAAITSFQVFEHVAEFDGLLEECRRLLQPRGALVVSVPHGAHVFSQEHATGCPDMPPNHINRWVPESMKRAMERHGFTVVSQEREPPQWRNLAYCASLRVRSTASQKPNSLAARSFGIKRRAVRLPLQVMLSGLALPGMLPRLRDIRAGHSFITVAERNR